jgi:hypothetical protein
MDVTSDKNLQHTFFEWEVKPQAQCRKFLRHVKRFVDVSQILNTQNSHSFVLFHYSLPDVSAGRIARELWWTSQEFTPNGIITMVPRSHINRGMNNMPVGGRSSETSHPIGMINQINHLYRHSDFSRHDGLVSSRAWHALINMISNQKAGVTRKALDKNQQPPLASAPSWTWNSGRYVLVYDTDWFSRHSFC